MSTVIAGKEDYLKAKILQSLDPLLEIGNYHLLCGDFEKASRCYQKYTRRTLELGLTTQAINALVYEIENQYIHWRMTDEPRWLSAMGASLYLAYDLKARGCEIDLKTLRDLNVTSLLYNIVAGKEEKWVSYADLPEHSQARIASDVAYASRYGLIYFLRGFSPTKGMEWLTHACTAIEEMLARIQGDGLSFVQNQVVAATTYFNLSLAHHHNNDLSAASIAMANAELKALVLEKVSSGHYVLPLITKHIRKLGLTYMNVELAEKDK